MLLKMFHDVAMPMKYVFEKFRSVISYLLIIGYFFQNNIHLLFKAYRHFHGQARQILEVRVLPNQYLPFLRRSKFNSVLSSHWLLTPNHSYECLVRVTRTCMIHVRFYVRFSDTRKIRMVSSESLVRVSRTCVTTFSETVVRVRFQ